jgi:hypothetical protein
MGKPKAKVIGENGNVFNILAIASLALKHGGERDLAAEMRERVFEAKSYDESLSIMQEYVEFE